ncbi:hypothetical protein CVT26_004257 [Gymnopilus dilepis]|uniref:Uncharacterized protein n=1 Tax=Gymnopilus dilepis TaxID=231916 RepID=A0A409YVJ4_9AGAR|nr:hypothetical protein CVT26_004257 [Gymnopilus dilepis]
MVQDTTTSSTGSMDNGQQPSMMSRIPSPDSGVETLNVEYSSTYLRYGRPLPSMRSRFGLCIRSSLHVNGTGFGEYSAPALTTTPATSLSILLQVRETSHFCHVHIHSLAPSSSTRAPSHLLPSSSPSTSVQPPATSRSRSIIKCFQ